MATVDSVAREIEDLRGKLRLFEEQQAKVIDSMSTQVQSEVKNVTSNLDTLYKETLQAMTSLGERVKKLETSVNFFCFLRYKIATVANTIKLLCR